MTNLKGLVWIMAAACGVSVANIYYNQPLLAQIRGTFAGDSSYLPMFTQVGVGFGMFLFVPLGDLLERRGLIVTVCLGSAAAAVLVAVAPSLKFVTAASALLGLTAIVPHLILPFAAQVAPPKERGRVVGTVLSGLLIGVLLARTASGFIGAAYGWRLVYWTAAVLMTSLALILGKALPTSYSTLDMPYAGLVRSLWSLVREQPLLQEAALIGGMLFGAFSAFWATLVFHISTPPFHYGARIAGLFGLIGVAGALAAPAAGRVTDHKSPRYTVGMGIWVTMAAYVCFWLFGRSIAGLIAGVVLLDAGTQSGHVANQTRIYNLIPEARGRLNTVYMVTYFAGGALGSALGAYGWSVAQWDGVCVAGMGMALGAVAVHLLGGRRMSPEEAPT